MPRNTPVNPPEINKLTNPMANNIPGVNRIFPLHHVVSQLNTLIADGTAINNVSNTKKEPRKGFMPVTNIWCAHTTNAKAVMANKEPTIAMYPKIGFRELIDMTSEAIPIAGKIIIYTSGWPKNQNKCWNKIGLPP